MTEALEDNLVDLRDPLRIHHSLAETGDMVGGLLREGNAGPAENADTWIPHLVRRLNESTGAQVREAGTLLQCNRRPLFSSSR